MACIVSIGTGLARVNTFPSSPKIKITKLIESLKQIATEADRTAERVHRRFRKSDDTYFRFNVTRGLEDIDLAEWEHLDKVELYTAGYMRQETQNKQIDKIVTALLASRRQPGPDNSTALIPVSPPFSAPVTGVAGLQGPPLMLQWHHGAVTMPDFYHTTDDLALTSM